MQDLGAGLNTQATVSTRVNTLDTMVGGSLLVNSAQKDSQHGDLHLWAKQQAVFRLLSPWARAQYQYTPESVPN